MIELQNVTKYFPGVCALDDVSCTFNDGEIHALLGENGAGKSTMIKAICGMHRQDSGTILIDGKQANFANYNDALKNGISIVNQEIHVFSFSSVAENIMMDRIEKYRTIKGLDWNAMYRDTQTLLDIVKLDVSPQKPVGPLSAAQKQLIQIAKALGTNAKNILLDEPTSSLTQHETKQLFRVLLDLKAQGFCILFISHKIEEVLEICDQITILRDGRHINTCSKEGLNKQQIIEMMLGRESSEVYLGKLDIDYSGSPALAVEHLKLTGMFEDMSFSVRRGEVLGFYGLVGSGRTEVAKVTIGAYKKESGRILLDGKEITINNVDAAVNKYRIGYVSENRKEEGLILDFSVQENINITMWSKFKKGLFFPIQRKKEEETADNIIDSLSIKTTGRNQISHTLSGGNQQKISIGKWLALGCDVLFIDEPTVGVDVGVKDAIHEIIWNLAKKENKAIILISSDLPEMIKLSRRILVFRDREIVSELDDLNDLDDYSYATISRRIGEYLV